MIGINVIRIKKIGFLPIGVPSASHPPQLEKHWPSPPPPTLAIRRESD
ncbi:MAG: hypothetical protein N2112_10480 [Gemmataceae bacterium]|nr:hypothetical protein [Gemmataceae bacterium]